MNGVTKAILGIALAALLATGIVVTYQARQLAAAQQQNNALNVTNTHLNATLNALKAAEKDNLERIKKLRLTQQHISATLAQRLNQIQELQHDNADVQHWANTRLPTAIISLRRQVASTADNANPTLPVDSTLPAANSNNTPARN